MIDGITGDAFLISSNQEDEAHVLASPGIRFVTCPAIATLATRLTKEVFF